MDVDDASNTQNKLDRQWTLLEESDIDGSDRKAIHDFVRMERQGNQDMARNTLYRDLSSLRNASDRAEVPLVEMDRSDYRDLIRTLTKPKDQDGYGLEPNGSGMRGYKAAIKVFFEWLDDEPEYGDFGFYEGIDTPSQSISRVNEDEILEPEDVEALKQHTKNHRDPALIEFLVDSCARASLALQLRVKDVHDLNTKRPYFTPNPNGSSHKGAPDKRYPILQSSAELRTWLNQNHPDPRDESPLWPVLRNYDYDNPEECALSTDALRSMLKICADRAGIEKPVNPHNFRHTGITRLSREGLQPQQIQHIAGWNDDRMLQAYDHTTDRQRNEKIRVETGYVEEADDDTGPSKPKTCGNCRETLKPTAQFCPRCGAPADRTTEDAIDEQDDRIIESAAQADTELAGAVLEFRQLLNESPRLRRELLDV